MQNSDWTRSRVLDDAPPLKNPSRRMNARKVRKALVLGDYRSGPCHRSAAVESATNGSGTKADAIVFWHSHLRRHAMGSRSRYATIEKQHSLTKETNRCREHGSDRCRGGEVLAGLRPLRVGLIKDLRHKNRTLSGISRKL